MSRILLLFLLSLSVLPCVAQTQPETPPDSPTPQRQELTPEERARMQKESEEAAAAACSVCGGGVVVMVVGFIIIIILNIALLIWVARDAKSRGMDSSVLWMFLVMFTSVIGLVIYLFSRPQGELVRCPSCGGKRLRASAKCPHCQNP